jgi:hypothetical protein
VSLYDRVAGLELEIQGTQTTRQSRETSSGFERHTTTVQLIGPDHVGLGEDVTYETTHHETLDADGLPDLVGDYTVDEFSSLLSKTDLFVGSHPTDAATAQYRRWALESAALDLALRQSGRSLASVLDRQYRPMRFVVSRQLPDGAAERVIQLLVEYPEMEFKLDPTPAWDGETISTLAETDAVRILDLKGQYEDIEVEQPADRALYEHLLSAFPDAIVEDPDLDPAVDDLIAGETGRLSWDAPVKSIAALEDLAYTPGWLNIKPSRFGSLESLFATVAYCRANGIRCYGGGQFELDVGRSHAQALAALLYPEGPNDLAPRVYNDPGVPEDAPLSPLPGFESTAGLPRSLPAGL